MNFVLIINVTPWGSSLSVAAWRLAQSIAQNGDQLRAVYFQGDGVYHALDGTATDAGSVDLHRCWRQLADDFDTELLLCSSASARRFPGGDRAVTAEPFRPAGLTYLLELMNDCDRVVSF